MWGCLCSPQNKTLMFSQQPHNAPSTSTGKMVLLLLLQPLPLYPTSLNCCPGQLPNLLVSVISFWWKQGWYTSKPKSRKMQRAGKKPKPQILYSCFETTWSVLAYIFTLQELSSFLKAASTSVVPWHPSMKYWPSPQPALSRTPN